jgi:hypothetical protein
MYHPSRGQIGAASIEAGPSGFTYNPSGALPLGVLPILTNAGAPTSGASGTFLGVATKGMLLVDTTNATLYQCSASSSGSITWVIFTTASGTGAFSGSYNGTIGATTPADGKFTTVEASGAITASGGLNGAIGGVTPADGKFTTLEVSGVATFSALNVENVAATVTAHAGGTQAAAFALTKKLNYISVCATTGDSVRLPASVAGMKITIFNGGAATARVFGAGTDTVDSAATATGVVLGIGARCDYICFVAGNWVSALLGAVSA